MRIDPYRRLNPGTAFSQHLEALTLAVVAKVREPSFIQIGANDGQLADDFGPLIKKYGLRGTCVEPLRDKFERLQENYREYDQVRCVNKAVHSSKTPIDLYRLKNPPKGLPSWVEGMASADRQHVERVLRQFPGADAHVVAERVACVSFDELVGSMANGIVHLLQIDAEGYDYEVLKLVDFSRSRPLVIRFEAVHLSRSDHESCLRMLAENGYRFIYDDRVDMIAVQPF